MPIYKMDGKKDGLQKYRVRINYVDREGKNRQLDRVAYGKENAKELERQLNYDLKSGEAIKSHMTVQQLYDEYIAVKKHEIRESTLRTVKGRLELYVLPNLKDCKIDKLNAPTLQKWKTCIEECKNGKDHEQKLSTSLKQGIFGEFRAMLNYAVKMEYIPKNPLSAIGTFRDPYATKKEMGFYTPDEFKRFIAVAKEQAEMSETNDNSIYEWNFYVFFNIAFYAGLRKGEINALKWTDIDNKILRVRRSITQKLKGDDRETPPKNSSSVRDLQMPTPLIEILQQHRARYERIDGFCTDWRICGGIKCLRDTTIQHRNERYAKAAELKVIRIHDYRHSHASLLANRGVNIQEIARRLGHTNIEITWNIYSHLYPREEEKAVEILNTI